MSQADRGKLYLPSPPTRREKYQYFGKHRPWVFGWILIASGGVLYGDVRVAARAWAIEPVMWLLLAIMMPPAVVNFGLRIRKPRLPLAGPLTRTLPFQPRRR